MDRITLSLDEAKLAHIGLAFYLEKNPDAENIRRLKAALELRILRAKTRTRRLP